MPTTFFLVRSGATLFGSDRVLGRRDLALTPEGQAQAQRAADLVGAVPLNELLASPMARTIQTAEAFAQRHGVGIGRDPRLTELDVGKWEGAAWHDLASEPEFHAYLAGEADSFPDGEGLESARRRAVASVEQTVADNPHGAQIVLVTHRSIIQLILAHYLDMPSSAFLRLHIDHGSVSVLRFVSEMQQPEVCGVNLAVPVPELLVVHAPTTG